MLTTLAIEALAREGGLDSTWWAGPEVSRRMANGEVAIEGQQASQVRRLIIRASQRCQVWVVSHSAPLIEALSACEGCNVLELEKQLGQTRVRGMGRLEEPLWRWAD